MINPLYQGLFYEPSQLLSMVGGAGFPDYGYYIRKIDANSRKKRTPNNLYPLVDSYRNLKHAPSFENGEVKATKSDKKLDFYA